MPAEVISYLLSSEDIEQRLRAQLILQCAPFLKGIKTACITNIGARDCRFLGAILQGTGIAYKILTVRKGRCLVFFYRQEEFAAYLMQEEVSTFLKSYGYQNLDDVDAVLQRLSARVCQYSVDEVEFPHEIGAFLNYPIKDVESFIANEGKNSLLVGYWKVYHDPARAQMTFCAYDQAKTSAVNEFLSGKSIQRIARR